VLRWGNSLATVIADPRGGVSELRFTPYEYVVPLWILKNAVEWRMMYRISLPNVEPFVVLDSEVFILRDRSDDGRVGRSRLSRSPGVVQNAISMQAFENNSWRNQAKPSAFVTPGKAVSKEGFKRFKDQFDIRNTGTDNAGRVIYGDDGATYTAMSMSLVDAQLVEAKRFATEDLARLYGVPSQLINDLTRSTFTNSETAGRWLVQNTLLPWIAKIEAEWKRSVFGLNSDLDLVIDVSGLVRGDYAQRFAAYAIARANNFLSVDEVRAAEGYPPMADVAGDPPPDDPGP
jgi:HK97 family phage portal protein